jgi:hypothetical protein
MQHVSLYVFMDKKTGRLLGQFWEEDDHERLGCYSLFDLPEEHDAMGSLVWFPTIKSAKDWLNGFLTCPYKHIELEKELQTGTAKLDIVAYEYKRVVE